MKTEFQLEQHFSQPASRCCIYLSLEQLAFFQIEMIVSGSKIGYT